VSRADCHQDFFLHALISACANLRAEPAAARLGVLALASLYSGLGGHC
jgi:hypothetical protein